MSNGAMLVGVYGPREILPQSMWTGLTRPSLTMQGWQTPMNRAAEGFELSSAKVWLPLTEHSTADLAALRASLDQVSELSITNESSSSQSARWLGGVGVDRLGCWRSDKADVSLSDIAFMDSGRDVLEKPENFKDIRLCDTEKCLYPRHYDMTFNVPSGRRRLLYPDLRHFKEVGGRIITSWGDELPAVSESVAALQFFQHQSLPHVPRDESLLTIGGISQISILPSTGCWFTRSYYMTPADGDGHRGWQYDGYSRLKIPSSVAERYRYVNFALLGHRVVWLLTGHELHDPNQVVLNHKCGFRPCTNHGHIEEIDTEANNLHGLMMSIATKMVNHTMAIDEGVGRLTARPRHGDRIDEANINQFWSD